MELSWRDKRDKASRRLFYGLFFLLPLTAVFGHRGLAPWLLLASLPAFARGDFWQAAFGKLFDNPSLKDPKFAGFTAILFFCFWIFLSGFWSPKHHFGLALYVLAPVLVGGSVTWYALNLSRIWAWRLGRAFLLAIVGGMVVLALEGASGGVLRGLLPPQEADPSRDTIALARGVTALTPALFPAAAIAVRLWSKPAAVLAVILGLIAAALNDVTANVVAILIGMAATMVALAIPRTALKISACGAIAVLFAFPIAAMFIPVDAIYTYVESEASADRKAAIASLMHRLAIWKATATESIGGLPFGHGADYARMFKEVAPRIDVPGMPLPVSVSPNHPHNVFIQVWLELGVPGIAALTIFLYYGLITLLRANLSKAVSAASVGAFAAILVSVTVEGSLWQVWRMAAMALAASGVALLHSLEKR
ncbi:O-antigen ligase family protein [Hyphococcus sp. DH-69]|uniref:O-antigen ligase family protein n=1 Tax=Hyphococcus formosus TaxID=3143534 RepID=UPI00398A5F70